MKSRHLLMAAVLHASMLPRREVKSDPIVLIDEITLVPDQVTASMVEAMHDRHVLEIKAESVHLLGKTNLSKGEKKRAKRNGTRWS